MKLGFCIAVLILGTAQLTWGQTTGSALPVSAEATARELSADRYAVLGATTEQGALVRAQIRVMQPTVLPLRILFVPHWKYIDTARTLRLHVPAGYTSAMFTHLSSRSVFIDNDRYVRIDKHWQVTRDLSQRVLYHYKPSRTGLLTHLRWAGGCS